MKPPKFHVGQAVVCISEFADKAIRFYAESHPKANRIYHVREVVEVDGRYGVRLVEIANMPREYLEFNGEVAFDEVRFAPVELLPDEALAELLSETLEPITA